MRSHLVFVRADLLRKGVWAFHATGFLSLFMQILLKGVRKMTEVKKKDKKLLIGLAVLAALIAVFAILFFMFRPGTTQGAKSITIEVVDNHGDSTMYDGGHGERRDCGLECGPVLLGLFRQWGIL